MRSGAACRTAGPSGGPSLRSAAPFRAPRTSPSSAGPRTMDPRSDARASPEDSPVTRDHCLRGTKMTSTDRPRGTQTTLLWVGSGMLAAKKSLKNLCFFTAFYRVGIFKSPPLRHPVCNVWPQTGDGAKSRREGALVRVMRTGERDPKAQFGELLGFVSRRRKAGSLHGSSQYSLINGLGRVRSVSIATVPDTWGPWRTGVSLKVN